MKRKRVEALLIAVVLAMHEGGCASMPGSASGGYAQIGRDLYFPLQSASAFPDASVDQMVVARYAGRSFVFQTHIQIAAGTLHLVAMDPFGNRLETIEFSSHGLVGKGSDRVPAIFGPEEIVANMELVFASADDVVRQLGDSGGSIRDTASDRHIGKDGHDVIVIRYGEGEGWNRVAHLHNIDFGYDLDITSVETGR